MSSITYYIFKLMTLIAHFFDKCCSFRMHFFAFIYVFEIFIHHHVYIKDYSGTTPSKSWFI